jgi:hypothetical protein
MFAFFNIPLQILGAYKTQNRLMRVTVFTLHAEEKLTVT